MSSMSSKRSRKRGNKNKMEHNNVVLVDVTNGMNIFDGGWTTALKFNCKRGTEKWLDMLL